MVAVDEVGGTGEVEADEAAENAAYLSQVMIEIEDEVRQRRASGELPARAEAELEALFLEFAPPGVRSEAPTSVPEALQAVDAAVFVNPVVPIGSEKAGGALVKRGVRTATLWYMGYVTEQVSRLGGAVSRYLHQVERRLAALERAAGGEEASGPDWPALRVPDAQRADAWWVPAVVEALSGAEGRVLHAVCGDGWLVAELKRAGVDAYGVDPDPVPDQAALDLRSDELLAHLSVVAPAGLHGVVVTGLLERCGAQDRARLLDALKEATAPGGLVVLHSMEPVWWRSDEAPPDADLSEDHPLRPGTWTALLEEAGFEDVVARRPKGGVGTDFVVLARRT